ncbi:MAG: hypothetical protein IT179_07895 [Acidobacteria bacterium]|nr:hypothetical protein [Acidobacteriota bacterium]
MKSDIAVTRTRRLSKRVAVEVTMSANGVVCEWDPRQPDDLTVREVRRYIQVRDAAAQELARRTNEKIGMVTIGDNGQAALVCFHPDGRVELMQP